MKKKKKKITAVLILKSWRAPIAFMLMAIEIILAVVRAILRLPAIPFLVVAEWFYRMRRYRLDYWAETIEDVIEKQEERKEKADEFFGES